MRWLENPLFNLPRGIQSFRDETRSVLHLVLRGWGRFGSVRIEDGLGMCVCVFLWVRECQRVFQGWLVGIVDGGDERGSGRRENGWPTCVKGLFDWDHRLQAENSTLISSSPSSDGEV